MAVETKHAEWRRDLQVIDMHTHFDPARLGDCIQFMDQNGIGSMIDISPNCGNDFREKREAIEMYPSRFGVFTGINFDGFGEDGWIDRECNRIERTISAGAIGVKFWKDLGLHHEDEAGNVIAVDDERIAPIIETVGDLDGVVAFHIADPKAFFEPLTPENEQWETLQNHPEWWFGDRSEYPYDWWQLIRQLETVIGRHPDTTILGAHFGCAAEEAGYVAEVMRDNPNYIIDTTARLDELGRHDSGKIRQIFLEFQDRILFGTDLAVRGTGGRTATEVEKFYDAHWRYFETDDQGINPPFHGNWSIDAIDLPQTVLRKLYVDNANRHFGL